MDRETIIKLAREAGFSTGKRSDHIYGFDRDGDYTEELGHFAKLVAEHEREACSRARAAKPRELKPVGRGMLLDEQQFCFDKGWREGAASVRAAIRARGNHD